MLSISVITGFLLTLLNAFDLMVIFLILFFIILMVFMNLKRKKALRKQFNRIYTRIILYTVIKFEKDEFFIDRDNVNKLKKTDSFSELSGLNRKWQYALATVILVVTYSSRYFFYEYDSFTLSESWYYELSLIKEISAQRWFFHSGSMMGDHVLINIYGKLAHLSDAIALQSFGLIEISILALVLYWVSYKITGRHGPGCIAAFSFGFLYAFLPLNIDQLLQHKSIFLALTLAIPTMVFSIYPKALRLKHSIYLRWMTYFFSAVLLIDLYVGLYIIPPFLVLTGLFNYKYRKPYVLRGLLAYVIAFACVGIIYYAASIIKDQNLRDFVISNLFSFNSYTYTPQLIIPFDSLMHYYQGAAVLLLIISFVRYTLSPEKWTGVIIFMVYFNLLFNLYWLDDYFLDYDLFTQTISVFLPLFFGLGFYILSSLIPTIKKSVRFITGMDFAIATAFVFLIGFFTKDYLTVLPVTGYRLQDQIFDAYIDIESSRLPYSYTVVNSNANSILSRGSHYYLSYNVFNADYLDRDARFNKFKKNTEYLRKHTELILPQSVLVFIYNDEALKNKSYGLYEDQQTLTRKQLARLKERGRSVELVYKKPLLEVYEIINRPRSSKINDLIF
ncbi:hypothetical protein [Flavimarina sp. Hel_I_48]|uniref:hypothetical protein n=1 Tax=Flavimarina sp. Hel_I_48 TaxID=1392488 RepID=UPI0013DD0E11|nr:hypothetical protein [Flavimarina sp. Hel_I_48]